MYRFLTQVAYFVTPLGLLCAFPLAVLWRSGEFHSVQYVETLMQRSTPLVHGPAYNNYRQEYQRDMMEKRTPEVITLGSSRVGEFRAAFFKNPTLFQNGTGGFNGALSGMSDFVQDMPTPPRIIIASMDQYFFQPEDAKNRVVERPYTPPPHSAFYEPFFESFFRAGGWWKVYSDYSAGKINLHTIFGARSPTTTATGLRAVANGSGFTNDGSDYYGEVIYSPALQEKTASDIAALSAQITETYGDEYGSGISEDALAQVRRLLNLARSRGVIVIGFLPPMSHAVHARLAAYPEAPYAYAYRHLGGVLAGIYKEYGFDFYDFSDITSFGASDKEMLDSKHGSEKMYTRLFIVMAQHSAVLQPLTDIPYLQERLRSANSDLVVFGLEPGY